MDCKGEKMETWKPILRQEIAMDYCGSSGKRSSCILEVESSGLLIEQMWTVTGKEKQRSHLHSLA